MSKIDLLPHLDLDRSLENLRVVRLDDPHALASARTGEGLDAWFEWLTEGGRGREAA